MINQRYLRNNLVDWFSQDSLQKKYMAIIGCGAVGNEVIKNLALLGVGKLDVYDFDEIEIHNLTRSVLFRDSDIGKKKSDVAAERAKELDPNIEITSYAGDFWDTITIDRMCEYDALICCVDNFETRLRINHLCVLFSKDFINTGIDSRYCSIETYPLSRSREAGCYECNLPTDVYRNIQERYSCGWLKKISFQDKIIPTTSITSSIAGALSVSQALRIDESWKNSNRIFIDSISGNSSKSYLIKNSQCPTCAITNDFVLIKVSRKIETFISNLPKGFDVDLILQTSEPILTSFRCVECHPRKSNITKVFRNARDYDSNFSICKICGKNTNQIEIKDRFTIRELMRKYKGFSFPCKFLTTIVNNQHFVFDLEGQHECSNSHRRPIKKG